VIDESDLEEERREARDHRDAGRLVPDESLRKSARAFLAAVECRAMASKEPVSRHAVHLAASLLVDHAAHEDARNRGQRSAARSPPLNDCP